MWTSSLLKENAKSVIKPYYWSAFGVEFIFATIVGMGSYAISILPSVVMAILDESGDKDSAGYYIGIGLVYLVMVGLGIVVNAFLSGVMETGKNRYFYQARNGNSDFGNLFWAFQGGRYMKVVKVMFWRYLEIMLWSLLFYVPGIIKMYEYFLVPYLMAENPDLSKERAFQISKQTMDGEKMNCFLFQLSFIGWYLLGAIACGIGIYFVQPYYDAAMTEFYACMRAKMLAMGIASEGELMDYSAIYAQNQNQNLPPNPNITPGSPYEQNSVRPNPYQTQNQNPNPYQTQNPNPYQTQNPYEQNQPDFNKAPENPDSKVDLFKHDDNQNQF